MESPEKRVRTDTGEEYTLFNLKELPEEILLIILEQLEDVWDLFVLGRVDPDLKDFIKRHDIFRRWFLRHLKVQTDQEADDLIEFIVNDVEHSGDYIELWFRKPNVNGWGHYLWFKISMQNAQKFRLRTLNRYRDDTLNLMHQLNIPVGNVIQDGRNDGTTAYHLDIESRGSFCANLFTWFQIIGKIRAALGNPRYTRIFLPGDEAERLIMDRFQCWRPFCIAALVLTFKHGDDFRTLQWAPLNVRESEGWYIGILYNNFLNALEQGDIRVTDVSSSGQERRLIGNRWMSSVHPKSGAFTQQARAHGMTVKQFEKHVLANPTKYAATTVRRANLSRNYRKSRK